MMQVISKVNTPEGVPVSGINPGGTFCLPESFAGIVSDDPVVYVRFEDSRLQGPGKVLAVDFSGKPIRGIDSDRLVIPMRVLLDSSDTTPKLLSACSVGDSFSLLSGEMDESVWMIVENPQQAKNGDVYAVNLSSGQSRTFNGDRAMKILKNPCWIIHLEVSAQ